MPPKHFLSSNSDFILSFFLGLIPVLKYSCEDFRTMLGNQHGIFPLCSQITFPTVKISIALMIDYIIGLYRSDRFQSNHHSWNPLNFFHLGVRIVVEMRQFVNIVTHAMACQCFDDFKPIIRNMIINRFGIVVSETANLNARYSAIKCFFSYLDKFCSERIKPCITDNHRNTSIRDTLFIQNPRINLQEITIF